MTKSELIEALVEKQRITHRKANEFVNMIFRSFAEELNKGGRIELRGFGIFSVRKYKAYAGRNPGTGENVEVKPKRLPYFRMSKELKRTVNEGD